MTDYALGKLQDVGGPSLVEIFCITSPARTSVCRQRLLLHGPGYASRYECNCEANYMNTLESK